MRKINTKMLFHKSTNNTFIYIIAMVSGISGMLFGYDTGVISGAILFIKQDYTLLPFLQELIVSAVLIGAIIGAFIGGSLADRYGRRKMIIIAAIIFAGGAIGTSLTIDILFLVIGRVIVGIAIGMASFIAPLYISEMSPPKIRGSLVSLNQLFITIGIVISYLVDYAFTPISGWRYMLGLAAIPALILLIAMIFMPNSPRWLINKGKVNKARSTLIEIRRTNNINNELNEIITSLDKQKGGRKDLLNPLIRPAMIVGISLAIFQQVTGINTVIYYAPTIFEFAGFQSAAAAIFATIIVGIVNVGFTIIAIFLLDRVGRRKLLLLGLTGMSGMLIMLGFVFFLPSLLNQLGTLAAISLIAYVAFFAIGLGPVFWLLISEIYPLKVRGRAMSVVTEANWGSNLIIALTFLTLIQLLGRSGTFWFYAIVGIMALIFTYIYVPETKGRTLEEIEEHWRGGKHPRELGK
ncbi:MAG: sugar porter family MFS transporter [Promethearchaeota archaeon]